MGINLRRKNLWWQDFRSEVLKRFEKVDEQFVQLEAKIDQRFDKINDRMNMLLLTIVGLMIATIVKLIAFNWNKKNDRVSE